MEEIWKNPIWRILLGSGLDRRKENSSSLDMSAIEHSSSWYLHGLQVASFLLNYQFNSACFWQTTLPLDTGPKVMASSRCNPVVLSNAARCMTNTRLTISLEKHVQKKRKRRKWCWVCLNSRSSSDGKGLTKLENGNLTPGIPFSRQWHRRKQGREAPVAVHKEVMGLWW